MHEAASTDESLRRDRITHATIVDNRRGQWIFAGLVVLLAVMGFVLSLVQDTYWPMAICLAPPLVVALGNLIPSRRAPKKDKA